MVWPRSGSPNFYSLLSIPNYHHLFPVLLESKYHALFALLTIYGIWKVWRLGYWRWLIITAISFAFVLNSHYLGLLLLPTVSFLFSGLIKIQNSKTNFYLLFSIFVFLA